MSEEDQSNRDREHDHEVHAFAVPIPPGLGQMLAHAHDRDHIEAESVQYQMYGFLDSLNVEQLMSLRRMLALDGKSPMNNYFEGQVVAHLRLAHHVNPDTGLTTEEALARATATQRESPTDTR